MNDAQAEQGAQAQQGAAAQVVKITSALCKVVF